MSIWHHFAASYVPSIDASTAVGITFSITLIMAASKTRSKTILHHPSIPNASYEVSINQKETDAIPLESNDAYATITYS